MTRSSKRILSVKIKRMVDESPDTSWLGEYSNTRDNEFSIYRAHAEDCASVRPDIQQAKQTLEHVQQTIADLHNAVLAQYNGTLANKKLDTERDALDDAYNEVGELIDDVDACDCGGHGDMQRGEYRYFNPSFNYFKPAKLSEPAKQARAGLIPSENIETRSNQLADGLTPEDVRKYTRQDYERMESLNRGNWCFIGISAEAEVIFGVDPKAKDAPRNLPNFCFHPQKITSGGLWGIESDSDRAYLETIEKDELAELRTVLLEMGFSKRAISTAFKIVEREDR